MWEGVLNGKTPVAIKSYKPGTMSPDEFLVEAQIMKQLNHEKLIKLYAVCTREEPIYIITELMKFGILLGYLQKGEGQNLKLPKLIGIAVQVTSGMAYMETHHYIHCNLAARSVMIGEGNAVKICNLGLAQRVDNDEHTTGMGKITIFWFGYV